MSCQTRFLQALCVELDDLDSMGLQGQKYARPSSFELRTDIAAYIGTNQNLDGRLIDTTKMLYLEMKHRWSIQMIMFM